MLDKLDKELAFGQQALNVRAYRQELLSSNIANADTPGYKARDVDFASSLAGALKKAGATAGATGTTASNSAPLAMAIPVSVSSNGSMASASGMSSGTSSGASSDDYGRLAYRIPSQPSLDGNTVDLDAERVQFADNALHFEAGMTVITGQLKSILSAITSNN